MMLVVTEAAHTVTGQELYPESAGAAQRKRLAAVLPFEIGCRRVVQPAATNPYPAQERAKVLSWPNNERTL